MLKIFHSMAIFLLVLMVFSAINCVEAQTEYEIISTEELAKKLENGEDLSLINVLPKIVHDARHIEGSINIPIGKIELSEKFPNNKHKLLIFYCMGTL